jgi:hypothetical protein
METHFIKLLTNSSCADIASRNSLEVGSVGTQQSRSGVAEIAKYTNLKGCPNPFVYIVYLA